MEDKNHHECVFGRLKEGLELGLVNSNALDLKARKTRWPTG